jgi:NADPH:quinone reductase-like Zn-dependent oxidoreductase
MHAIVQTGYGGPEVLREAEIPRPEPGPGQVLISVHAAAINPTDWKHRAGPIFVDRVPKVLGWDVSGVVAEVGYGVTLHEPGDEVFGMLPYPYGVGGYAEYAVAPARSMVAKPEGLDHVHAAALPLAGLTAWQALSDTAHIHEGQRVLIQGGAGGVGHLAVQIAKSLGAYVYATASADDIGFVSSIGADEVVDFRGTDIRETVWDVEMALVPFDGEVRRRSLDSVRAGGTLVTLAGNATEEELKAARSRGIDFITLLVESDHFGLKVIAELARNGKLRPRVAKALPLGEAGRAQAIGERGGVGGKLVLVP